MKTDVAKEDCDPEKNANGTQRFVMSDAEDDVLDEDEEKLEERPNGPSEECELPPQAQVNAMK